MNQAFSQWREIFGDSGEPPARNHRSSTKQSPPSQQPPTTKTTASSKTKTKKKKTMETSKIRMDENRNHRHEDQDTAGGGKSPPTARSRRPLHLQQQMHQQLQRQIREELKKKKEIEKGKKKPIGSKAAKQVGPGGRRPPAKTYQKAGPHLPSRLPHKAKTTDSDNEDSSECSDDSSKKVLKKISIDDAIERLGMGRFQYRIMVAAGLCFAADAMEVLLLSFLAVVVQLEWDLTPEQTSTITSFVFLGSMLGTLVLGPIGDVYGRKPVFTVTAAIIAVFGVLTSFAPGFEWLLLFRFMVGVGVGGLTIPFDTFAELLPTSHRGSHLMYLEYFWTGGTCLVPIVAFLTLGQAHDRGVAWRWFVFWCTIPCMISTALGLLYVPESPRWLLAQGRSREALRILVHAAECNGHAHPKRLFEGLELVTTTNENSAPQPENHGDYGILLSRPWRKLTLLLWAVWCGYAILYYGTIQIITMVFDESDADSQGQAAADGGGVGYSFDYAAIFASGSAEIVGLTLVAIVIDRWGRVPSQVLAYVCGGVAVFLLSIVATASKQQDESSPRHHYHFMMLALAFLSRMCMMSGCCTTWVSTAEMLPTEIRTTGHSAANALSRFGGSLSPYLVSQATPMRTIGTMLMVFGFLTGAISWQLPETRGMDMGTAATALHASRSGKTDDNDDDDTGAVSIETVPLISKKNPGLEYVA